MSGNLRIWDALAKTDPKHTKPFKRAGGFSGTAVKPIWIIKQLTEQFGPAGIGWGVNEPKFEVVPCSEGEILVYCTVSAWHGSKDNILWGVGGDKVVGKNKYGLATDDEAFKKAFTDAVNNAFKSIGVAADVHMGLFEDDKYVTQVRAEFAADGAISEAEANAAKVLTLAEAACVPVQTICETYNVSALNELTAAQVASVTKRLNLTIADNKKEAA